MSADKNFHEEYDKIKQALSKETFTFDGEIKKAKQASLSNEQIITPSGKHYQVPPPPCPFPNRNHGPAYDKQQQAKIELSYIRAAITLCEGSNNIGAELIIGSLQPIGISLNSRLIPVLQAEAEEIEKYLRGEENNYE